MTLSHARRSKKIRLREKINRYYLDTALSQVAVPLLVLQSTYINLERVRVPLQPEATTPWLELIRQHVPTAHIEIVSGVGHFPMLEAREAVNQSMAAFVATFPH